MKKKGALLVFIITIIYTIISFYNLGTLSNPQTFFEFECVNDCVILDLNNQNISKMRYYTGVNSGTYNIYVSDDLENYNYLGTTDDVACFSWNDFYISETGKYLYIQSVQSGTYLGEVVAFDSNDEIIPLNQNSNGSYLVVDEPDSVPKEISYLNSMYFDEIYHARTAYEFLHDLKPYEWTHPPLGKILISIPVIYLGMNTFSYRLMGNIAGILMIPIIYLIAKEIFKNKKCGVIAALIMACDGMHFSQTRLATVDSFLTLFIMISYLFMIRYLNLKNEDCLKLKIRELFFCGLFIGLAIDTKWCAFFGAMGLAIIFFVHLLYNVKINRKWTIDNTKIILSCIVSFIIIPIMIYILSYAPFFNCTESDVKDLQSLWEHQKEMYEYHSKIDMEHPFSSDWYTWPILYKPVFYYVKYFENNKKSTISCMGNPIIWWSSIVGVLYLINVGIIGIINKNVENFKKSAVILTLYATTWLGYAFIGRIMFLYHYFITLPFEMLALTALINFLNDLLTIENTKFFIKKIKNMINLSSHNKLKVKNKKNSNNRLTLFNEKLKIQNAKFVLPIFSVIIIVSFVYFYPIVSGYIVNIEYIENTKWLSSWIY